MSENISVNTVSDTAAEKMRKSQVYVPNIFRDDRSRMSHLTFNENLSNLTVSDNLIFQGMAKRDGDSTVHDGDLSSMNMSSNDVVMVGSGRFQKNSGRSGFAPSPNPAYLGFTNQTTSKSQVLGQATINMDRRVTIQISPASNNFVEEEYNF